MTAPNLTIAVEPANGGSVMFLPVAPKTANDKAQGEVALQFTIVDSAGKQTSATLVNKVGTNTAPPPTALLLTPPSTIDPAGCAGKTYSFLISGGTPPYNVAQSASPPLAGITVTPPVVPAVGGSFAVSIPGTALPATVVNLLILDSSAPQLSLGGSISCK